MGIANFGGEGFMLIRLGEIRSELKHIIRNQLQEDVIADQLSLFEEYDPFTGEKNKRK